MKKLVATLSILILFSLCNLKAQPGFDDDVEDTPIDGGISVLIIATVGYGLKKNKDRGKKVI
jgi:hypothetical protein